MRPAEPEIIHQDHAARAAFIALTLTYGAPTPGLGSRYADDGSGPAHEARMLGAAEIRAVLLETANYSLGQTLSRAVLASKQLTGFADHRAAAYLAPLVKANVTGVGVGKSLDEAGIEDARDFLAVFGEPESGGPRREDRALVGALDVAILGSRRVMLRDVMRFASRGDPLARDYATAFEISRDLSRPAILSALSRGDSSRAAVVQGYLETLAEVPDLDVVARAGEREAEEVSRMARGVVKAGGVHSRRGLEGVSNLGGLLREDSRLSPTATEPAVIAAAYLVCIEHGPGVLARSIRATAHRNRGR
ncbi:MAG: triphosphoribosyl-dephospho-CoA synthase [Rubrobacter sp.]